MPDGRNIARRASVAGVALVLEGAVLLRAVEADHLPPSGQWWPVSGSIVYDTRGTTTVASTANNIFELLGS